MPEILEVELYRRAAEAVVGARIRAIEAPDELVVADRSLPDALAGRRIEAAQRHGKLLLLGTDGPTVGVHFGMTGRLVVGQHAPIGALAYGASRDDARWDRFVVHLTDGRRLRLSDPRRLARVEADPDITRLGPDALTLRLADLRRALAGRTAPVKAVLLDQRAIAGLGNLLADEVLLRSSIDPARPAKDLGDDEVRRLHRAVRRALPALLARGGSHQGRLSVARRRPDAPCPVDGTPLQRRTIGGRTTFSCPLHQRPTRETDRS